MELESAKAIELEQGKVYVITVPSSQWDGARQLASALQENGINAIIVPEGTTVSDLCVLFRRMSPEDREKIRESLNYVNPVEHEQVK